MGIHGLQCYRRSKCEKPFGALCCRAVMPCVENLPGRRASGEPAIVLVFDHPEFLSMPAHRWAAPPLERLLHKFVLTSCV